MTSKDKLTMKRAEYKDIPRVAILFDEYRLFYGQESDLKRAEVFLKERMDKDQSVIFYAEMKEIAEPVGFVQLYPSFSSISLQSLWILNDLYVREEARRSGTGRALLQEAEQLARRTGAKGLTLSTSAHNSVAQKLYESEGYIRDNEFWHYDLLTK
ncbi:GNAT family N-acetyltransferase [Paenibacillus gallinarum]|uniref:GNAT family N-acetyltransferase n=1 Tax=Paenibacillus gallinarum TaxID=2762232 RepID=A0ABR8SUW3_9BACL|nr:GNAT family N-acetyltransferase [Paenibacillus gallinarum]MBD7967129.1 GNAT family N-acetyltransferase [Paenibacillus gallinarum]